MPHHPEIHCKECLKLKRTGCEAFNDKNNPIVDENGNCIARITDPEEYKKLLNEMKAYAKTYES